MKAKRPRAAGSKYSGERRSFSKPPSRGFKKRDGDTDSPGRGKDSSDRPYGKPRSAGSGYSRGPEREGRRASGDDRPGKRRSASSDGSHKKRTYGKAPWASKPSSRLDKKSFGDKKTGRFDKAKKPYGRSEEKPERKFFDKPGRGDGSERDYGKSKYEGEPSRERPARERRPTGIRKPFPSDGPRRDFNSSRDERSSYGKSSGGFRKDTRSGGGDEGSAPRPWNRKEDHSFYGNKRKFSKAPKPKEFSENDGTTRLNKFISNAGICSRREADEMIKAGVISVNGQIITEMGFKVKDGDEVRYNNETLRSEKMVYLLLNKPKDFITTSDDPENRKTVMSLLENACKERIYPVGRLDRNTSGLLLFTNDGELARRLTHPSFEVQKIYQVDLDKNLKPGDLEMISTGLQLEDGFIKPDAISYVGSGNDKSVVGIELHSGRNRIVRRIFEQLDYKVKKLDRVYFAGLSKKDLPRGRWRFLTDMEVAGLKMLTGDKKFKNLPAKPGAVSVD